MEASPRFFLFVVLANAIAMIKEDVVHLLECFQTAYPGSRQRERE